MKQVKHLLFAFLLITTVSIQAQVGIGTTTPAATAQLDVSSTTKGFLPPRMTTTQRDAISSPATGLVIFNSTTNGLEFKSSTGWVLLSAATTVSYPSVLIGTQYWMDKNLELTTYRNGDLIPYVTDPTAWASLTTGAWCYYNNDPSSGYGKLYNWYAVNDSRGLAPQGWHIPTDAEWTTLSTLLGGTSAAGGKMKTTGTTRWTSPNTGATNESGFAGLPGGGGYFNGTFSYIDNYGYWWSSTEYNTSLAWFRVLVYVNGSVERSYFNKEIGFSVRCLRD